MTRDTFSGYDYFGYPIKKPDAQKEKPAMKAQDPYDDGWSDDPVEDALAAQEIQNLKDKLKADTLTQLYIKAQEAEKKAEKTKLIEDMLREQQRQKDIKWEMGRNYEKKWVEDYDDWADKKKLPEKAPWSGGNPFEPKGLPNAPLNPKAPFTPKVSPKELADIKDFIEKDQERNIEVARREWDDMKTKLGEYAAEIRQLRLTEASLNAALKLERERADALTAELEAIKNPPKVVLEPDETGKIDKAKRFRTITTK